MILVTGATGNNGLEILKRLASQNVQARAMVRDRNRAKAITDLGFEMVEADFDRPETLPSALAGVDRAFLVTNSTEHAETQQLAFVEAAKQSGVKHIVKLSQFAANADSPVRFFALPCGCRIGDPSNPDGVYVSAPQSVYAGLVKLPIVDRRAKHLLRCDR